MYLWNFYFYTLKEIHKTQMSEIPFFKQENVFKYKNLKRLAMRFYMKLLDIMLFTGKSYMYFYHYHSMT